MQNKDLFREEFKKSVDKYFHKVDQTSLQLQMKSEDEYVIYFDNCKARILLFWGHLPDLNLLISPAGKMELGINVITEFYGADSEKISNKLSKPDEVETEIAKIFYLFNKYCLPKAKNNFEEWDKYKSFLSRK